MAPSNKWGFFIMTAYTFSDELYSDLHKDALGFRPGEGGYARWASMSDDQKQDHWDYLIRTMELEQEREAMMEKEAIVEFEKHVTGLIANGAKDRQTALRWIMDASICDGDWEFLCFEHGLPYGYFQGNKQ